jgi:hypothetical protein
VLQEFKEILNIFCPWIPVDAVQERVNSIRSSMRESRRRKRAVKENISQARSGAVAGDGKVAGSTGVHVIRESDSLTAMGPSVDPVLTNVVTINKEGASNAHYLSVDTQIAYRKALDTSVMVAENISGLTEMTVLTTSNNSPSMQQHSV